MNMEAARIGDLIRRRWLVMLVVCIIGLTLLALSFKFLPIYAGNAEVLIVSQTLNKDTTLSDPDLPSIVTSTDVMTRVIKKLHLDTNPVQLAKKVKTKLPARSSILELTYKDVDAKTAANVANAVADEAVGYFHEIATRGYTDVISALDVRIARTRATIADTDKRLQLASANSGFGGTDKGLDDMNTQINDLKAQRGEYNSTLAADQATASALKSQLNDVTPIVHGEILQKDPVFQQVQTVVGRDTADLISERASFKDIFPGLGALTKRVDSEHQQIKTVKADAIGNGAGESPTYTQTVLDSERADGVVSADQERLRATDEQLAQEQQHVRSSAGPSASISTLRAERDAAVQDYLGLTQRLSSAQADAAQAASLGTLVVVSRAIPGPPEPILPLIFFVLIVAIAFGIAYAIEALAPRYWSIRDVELLYGRPVLLEVGKHA